MGQTPFQPVAAWRIVSAWVAGIAHDFDSRWPCFGGKGTSVYQLRDRESRHGRHRKKGGEVHWWTFWVKLMEKNRWVYTPQIQHGTWKWWFPIGMSFSKGPFSGSMFVLGVCKFNFVELKTTFLFQIGPDWLSVIKVHQHLMKPLGFAVCPPEKTSKKVNKGTILSSTLGW